MIKMDISTVLFLYIFFTAVLVLAAWSFFDLGRRLKTFGSEEKYIWHCTICANTYIDSRHDELSLCPRCKSYNQRIKKEDLLRTDSVDRGDRRGSKMGPQSSRGGEK